MRRAMLGGQSTTSCVAERWVRGDRVTRNESVHTGSAMGGTVNTLCLDSGLREATVWDAEKVLSECMLLTWAQSVKDSRASGSGVWQSLPGTGDSASVDSVCRKISTIAISPQIFTA